MKNILLKIREWFVLYIILGPNQRTWLLFLKNNPDKHMKNQLGKKSEDSYKACCLGQAGLMFGYCEWKDELLQNSKGGYTLPADGDNEKYLGLRDRYGNNKNGRLRSLATLNDILNWLAVYNAVINDPKNYFTKRI